MTLAKAVFLVGLAICLVPVTPPWLALCLGIAVALALGNPFPNESKNFSKILLQACVVLLGFGMDLNTVLKAGSQGILFALASISAVFCWAGVCRRLWLCGRSPGCWFPPEPPFVAALPSRR